MPSSWFVHLQLWLTCVALAFGFGGLLISEGALDFAVHTVLTAWWTWVLAVEIDAPLRDWHYR